MTQEQKLAHARMLASLPVRTHIKMNVPQYTNPGGKKSSEAGRKGREAAGLVIPVFRTRKQHMSAKRKAFNHKIK